LKFATWRSGAFTIRCSTASQGASRSSNEKGCPTRHRSETYAQERTNHAVTSRLGIALCLASGNLCHLPHAVGLANVDVRLDSGKHSFTLLILEVGFDVREILLSLLNLSR
jgi:hypothetical protein